MAFDGQTVVVTGASGGIGRAVAVRFASLGANVVIHYSHSREKAMETAAACREAADAAAASAENAADPHNPPEEKADSRFPIIQADLSDPLQAEHLFSEAMKLTGRIEVLVCNAGISKDGLLVTMKDSDFDLVQKTNLYGTYFCMKQASKIMLRQRYGRIVALSSIVGIHGNAGQVSYAASKAGIIGMTKSLAQELARRNITVNAVAPGMIDTEMTRSLPEKTRQSMRAKIPAGRAGNPDEVAEAVAFFARKESGYITGQVLGVDGGMGA